MSVKLAKELAHPEQFNERMKIIVAHIEQEFTVPVLVGVVVAAEDGGPFSFITHGTMDAPQIAWAGNATDVIRTVIAAKAQDAIDDAAAAQNEVTGAQQSEASIAYPIPGVPDDADMPLALRKALHNAAKEGKVKVVGAGSGGDGATYGRSRGEYGGLKDD